MRNRKFFEASVSFDWDRCKIPEADKIEVTWREEESDYVVIWHRYDNGCFTSEETKTSGRIDIHEAFRQTAKWRESSDWTTGYPVTVHLHFLVWREDGDIKVATSKTKILAERKRIHSATTKPKPFIVRPS